MAVEVTTSLVSPTEHGVEGALDVEVEIAVNGVKFSGGATMVRDHNGRWNSWGSPDNWASLEVLEAAEESGDYAATLAQVSAECSEACGQ